MERGTEESPRGYHALRVLTGGRNWTMASVTAAAFDSYLPAFATMIPVLVKAYDAAPESDPLRTRVSAQIAVLRAWDYRWGVNSVATSLAVFWGEDIFAHVQARADGLGISPEDYVVAACDTSGAADIPGSGIGPPDGEFRRLGDPVGPDQPFPAHQRRHQSELR